MIKQTTHNKNLANLTKVSVTSGYIPHTFHAVVFPLPANIDTVSHPVNAHQKNRDLDSYSPSNFPYM